MDAMATERPVRPERPMTLFGRRASAGPLVPPLTLARWILVLLFAAGVYFFHDFLVPVLASVVVAVAAWPIHAVVMRMTGGRTTVAATVSLALTLAVIVLPATMAASYALQEIRDWSSWAIQVDRTGEMAPDWVASLPAVGTWAADRWNATLGRPGFIGNLSEVVSGRNLTDAYHLLVSTSKSVLGLVLNVVFFLIALFFVFKDGPSFARQLDLVGERILPKRWRTFSDLVPSTIRATVTGMGMIAVGEGLSLGLAYWLTGAPSPVTLGIVTGFMALIPGGAPLTFGLISLYLLGNGSTGAALALFAWGTVELFVVDKTLRPRLVGGPIKLPFLPTFFGLVGGVKTMGLLGIFIGPVIMALIVAMWREWLTEIEHETVRPSATIVPLQSQT